MPDWTQTSVARRWGWSLWGSMLYPRLQHRNQNRALGGQRQDRWSWPGLGEWSWRAGAGLGHLAAVHDERSKPDFEMESKRLILNSKKVFRYMSLYYFIIYSLLLYYLSRQVVTLCGHHRTLFRSMVIGDETLKLALKVKTVSNKISDRVFSSPLTFMGISNMPFSASTRNLAHCSIMLTFGLKSTVTGKASPAYAQMIITKIKNIWHNIWYHNACLLIS